MDFTGFSKFHNINQISVISENYFVAITNYNYRMCTKFRKKQMS